MSELKERQQQIEHQKIEAIARYPHLWSVMIAEWNADGEEDRLWLMYSSNYLLRTAGIHWAVDPVELKRRLPAAQHVELARSLSKLSLILLTHQHKDHLDLDLLRVLSATPTRWVVPETLLAVVIDQAGVPPEHVTVPYPLIPIHLEGLTLTPFEGLHWDQLPAGSDAPPRGVPSTGYLAEFSGKRWLFPGDVRTYNPSLLPHFKDASALDGVFAHLWLGRGQALADDPPLLEAFCRFFSELKPRQIVISHMHEFGRSAEDYWNRQHYEKAAARLGELAPQILVRPALMGESVSL